MRLTEKQREAKVPDTHTQRVIEHLKAENAYSDVLLAPVKALRDTLYQEMKGRIKETDMSVPYRENGYWYTFPFRGRTRVSPCTCDAPVPGEEDGRAGRGFPG